MIRASDVTKLAGPLCLSALCLAAPVALAQTPPAGTPSPLAGEQPALPQLRPTNVDGVASFAAPPPGFDAVQASDAALAAYGFPPRPLLTGDGRARRDWARLVAGARLRVEPVLRALPGRGGPQRGRVTIRHGAATTSENWSGITITSGATSLWLGSFTQVVAAFNVPVVQQAFGVCDGGWDYSAVWVGLDGITNNAVLQAGTEADAYCSGTYKQQNYYAWVEWYPANALQVTNLPVSAGDMMSVWVYGTGTTTGRAFLVNSTTNQYVSMALTAPSGTVLQGSSAEWIMERPANLNGTLTTLANYVTSYMSNMSASQPFGQNFPPSAPPPFSNVSVNTMTDSAGNPLSLTWVLGSDAILFQDTGAAR